MAPFLHNGLNYGKERCQNDVVADSEAIGFENLNFENSRWLTADILKVKQELSSSGDGRPWPQ